MVENVQPTPFTPFVGRNNIDISVQIGGVIDGNGVKLRNNLVNPSPFGAVNASVVNAGTISANSGAGLFATDPNLHSFQNITNLATGTIRGINAPFNQIDNRGSSLFVTLTYPREITATTQFVVDGKWVQPYRPGEGFLYDEMSELLGVSRITSPKSR